MSFKATYLKMSTCNKTQAFLGEVFPEYKDSESYIPELLFGRIGRLEKKDQENQKIIETMMSTLETLMNTIERREKELKEEINILNIKNEGLVSQLFCEGGSDVHSLCLYHRQVRYLINNKYYDIISNILNKDISSASKSAILNLLLRDYKTENVDIEIVRSILFKANISKEYIFDVYGSVCSFDGFGDKDYILKRIDEIYDFKIDFKIGTKIWYKKRKIHGEIIEIDQITNSYTIKLENGRIIDTISENIEIVL